MDWTYSESPVAIPAELGELHRSTFTALGEPGTWWTGQERSDMVREVRAARECSHCEERSEALVPMAVAGEHTAATSLSAEVVEVVHRVTTDASRITGSWASARIAALDAAPYSEIIGTVAIVNALDVHCKALGLAVAEAPAVVLGEPSRVLPRDVTDTESAYVPQDPDHQNANVRRALTMVPQTLNAFFGLVGRMYSGAAFGDLIWNHRALDRPQVELLAARTSALNECFY